MKTLTQLAHFFLATAKAIWGATVQTAWGMATFFLLAALIGYYKADASSIEGLFVIIRALMDNWQVVFAVLFAFEILSNIKDIKEKDE